MDETNPESTTEDQAQGKDNSTKVFLALAAVMIVLFAVFFFLRFHSAPANVNEKTTYNGFVFEKFAGLWTTKWQNEGYIYDLQLHYSPQEVEHIQIQGDDGWSATGKTYITFDPQQENLTYVALSAAELSLSLVNTFDIDPIAACTINATEACSERPIVNCGNNETVIYISNQGAPRVVLEGKCAAIHGTGNEMLKASEKVIYQWYGIIRPE